MSLPDEELARADLSSMLCLIANAAPVPYALKQEIIDKLGDGFLFEVYGSTELGVDTVLAPEDQLRKPGSCGKPYGGIEMRIVKDDGADRRRRARPGELFVRTGLAMDGYHHTDEQLTELADDEWKSVGDVAYVDDEGYVYICDRKKDMIISGGVNIYPGRDRGGALRAPADPRRRGVRHPRRRVGRARARDRAGEAGGDHRPRRAARLRRIASRALQAARASTRSAAELPAPIRASC